MKGDIIVAGDIPLVGLGAPSSSNASSSYKGSKAAMPSNVPTSNVYKPSKAAMPSNVPSAQPKYDFHLDEPGVNITKNTTSNTSGSSQGGTKTASKVTSSSSSSSSSKSTSSKSSGSNKKSGVNKKVAKQAYQNVQKDLQDLEKYMNKLVDDVQKMNELYWYGDKLANTWYSTMSGHYSQNKNLNLIKFYKGVASFQTSLKTVFQKANINKITF